MAKIIQLVQGTQEWLDYRRTMRNASETAAVLGESPWTTPYQLWLQKTGRSIVKATAAMQHGTDTEPAARAAYEATTGNIMQPVVLQDGVYSASLDGMDLYGKLIVEIKCPFKGRSSALWGEAMEGRIPSHYALQIQHQLMVSGASHADLWIFDGSEGISLSVDPVESEMERIRAGWDHFQTFIDTEIPPELLDADTAMREDSEWMEAAHRLTEAKRAMETVDAAFEKAKKELVALAQHPREQGGGVSVTRYWKTGAVDYKKVPVLSGMSLEQFRGKAREEVRVTVAN